jgi:hypothetical protein
LLSLSADSAAAFISSGVVPSRSLARRDETGVGLYARNGYNFGDGFPVQAFGLPGKFGRVGAKELKEKLEVV